VNPIKPDEHPANPESQALLTQEPTELWLEAADEGALARARERMAARVRLLLNKRRILIRGTILGLMAATAIAFLIPKRYKSTAKLMPPTDTFGSAGKLAALSSQLGGAGAETAASALGVKTTGALFIGILRSNTVEDDVIQKFNLQHVYHARYLEDARKALASHTDISEEERSGIISVSVIDENPARAASIPQEYINQLNWVVNHLSTSSAHRERIFLDHRLEQVKTDLDDAETQFSQFSSEKGALNIPAQGEAMLTAAATLQGQLISAEAELEGLRQIFTDNNVRVREVEARVNKLRIALERIAGKGANEKSSAQQLYPSMRELPLLGVTYADLLRRTKVEEAVFETLTQQDELAQVEEAREIPSVRVLDAPEAPQNKSFPPRLAIIALGTMLAFAFSTLWILANSAWEAVDEKDPRKAVAIEVWAEVHSKLPWNSQNGSSHGGPKHWLRHRFRRRHESDQATEGS
jgi:uncharacterized protein involved in exopolysaccharide biosynthesis